MLPLAPLLLLLPLLLAHTTARRHTPAQVITGRGFAAPPPLRLQPRPAPQFIYPAPNTVHRLEGRGARREPHSQLGRQVSGPQDDIITLDNIHRFVPPPPAAPQTFAVNVESALNFAT